MEDGFRKCATVNDGQFTGARRFRRDRYMGAKRKTLIATIGVILLLVGVSYAGIDYYTAQSAFCGGSCHTMTEQYEAWKRDAHHESNNADGKQAADVCHVSPMEERTKHGDV